MPTTIISGFNTLKNNLEITSLQKSTVSTRQNNIRDAVEDGFIVLDSFLAGSYARSTMITPLKESDVDIFVVIDSSYYSKYSPTSLLDRLRTILKRTYPSTPQISRNGQAVTISFTDFKVDVVPSFNRKGGGYLIPDSVNKNWISTDPKVHQQNLTASNKWHDGNLIPVIKMLKGWNRCLNNPFYGYYLELMVKNILTNITITDYPSAARYVFDKGREKIKYTISDPASFSDQVKGFNNIRNKKEAVSRLETAYNRAIKAENYEYNMQTNLAFDEWKKIYPRYFPSYR